MLEFYLTVHPLYFKMSCYIAWIVDFPKFFFLLIKVFKKDLLVLQLMMKMLLLQNLWWSSPTSKTSNQWIKKKFYSQVKKINMFIKTSLKILETGPLRIINIQIKQYKYRSICCNPYYLTWVSHNECRSKSDNTVEYN